MFRQPSGGSVQHRLRQDQAVGGNDDDIRPQRRQRLNWHRDRAGSAAAAPAGPRPAHARLTGEGSQLLAAPGGPIRLGQDADDPMAGGEDRVERPLGESRGAGEDDPRRRGGRHGAEAQVRRQDGGIRRRPDPAC